MSKKEKTQETLPENPFGGFSLLNGPEDPSKQKDSEVNNDLVEEPTLSTEEEEKFKKSEEEFLNKKKSESNNKTTEETEESEIEENTNEEDSKNSEDEFSFKPFVKHFSDKGILDVNVDDIEDNEEGLETAISKTVESKIASWKAGYGEDANKFLEFIEAGGDPKQFLDVYYGKETSWRDYKIDSEATQKEVIKNSLKLAGWSDSEITDELQDIEDLGKLEVKAKAHLPKLQKYEDDQKEYLSKAQKEYAVQQQENIKNYWEDLKGTWDKKEDVQGFKLTPKLKEEVWKHMSVPDKKTGKTKLQLNNETNKDAQFLYAMFDYLNWDVSKFEKQVKTKVTSELRKNLSNFSDGRTKLKSGNTKQEDLENENPFAGFKSII